MMIRDAQTYGVSPVNDAVIEFTDAAHTLLVRLAQAYLDAYGYEHSALRGILPARQEGQG